VYLCGPRGGWGGGEDDDGGGTREGRTSPNKGPGVLGFAAVKTGQGDVFRATETAGNQVRSPDAGCVPADPMVPPCAGPTCRCRYSAERTDADKAVKFFFSMQSSCGWG
jgi:hypothetical protein